MDEPDEEAVKITKDKKEEKRRGKRTEKKKPVDDRYKGYEILLDYDEDPDFVPPKGEIKRPGDIENQLFMYRSSYALKILRLI